jgi:hypothetical protein
MKIEDLEEMLNRRIIEAYSNGYSVVEITRALRKTSVDSVHSLLRDTGHIPVMERSEYRREYDIDPKLTKAFRAKGFSFGRWCLGWKFDPISAAVGLNVDPQDGRETTAHLALRRDFPEVFTSIYGVRVPKKAKRRRGTTHPPSLRIDWNAELRKYVSVIPEYPMIEARGNDWDEAFFGLKSAYRLYEYIMRLNRLTADEVKN